MSDDELNSRRMMKRLTAAIASVLMTMPVIAFSTLSVIAPVKADEKDMNIGRLIGWIQATCAYAQMNRITPDLAERTIGVSLKSAERDFGRNVAMSISRIEFNKAPKCQRFWPVQYLGD